MRRPSARVVGWVLAVSVVAACGGPRMKLLTDKRYAPRPVSYSMALYQGTVETPHEEIAILDSHGVEELTTETQKLLVEDLRARARRLGADAVTNVTLLIRPERGWVPDPQTPFRSWRQGWREIRFLRGHAIRFKPLLVETGESSPTAGQFDFAGGERPVFESSPGAKGSVERGADGSVRPSWLRRRAEPIKPRSPAVERGD